MASITRLTPLDRPNFIATADKRHKLRVHLSIESPPPPREMGTYVDNRTNGHQGTARMLGMNWTLGHVEHLAVLAPYLLVRRANRYFENPYFGGAVATVVHRACGLRGRIRRRFNRFFGHCRPQFISAHTNIKDRLLGWFEVTMESGYDVRIPALPTCQLFPGIHPSLSLFPFFSSFNKSICR